MKKEIETQPQEAEKPFHTKYRPGSFSEIIGNEETVSALEALIKERSVRTYMLCGKSGCGKTTLARIMAKNLGVKSKNNIKEYNLGNTGNKDDGRNLNRKAGRIPFSGGAKVFILDEIQGASPGFFQTVLKLFEEPPRNTYFVLCTTDPDKIPEPIKTRCSVFKVDLLDKENASELIKGICEKEEIQIKKQEIRAIINKSNKCPREICTLLQKIANVDSEDRIRIINDHYQDEEEKVADLCQMLMRKESWKSISAFLKKMNDEPENIRYAILGYLNTVLLNNGELRIAEIIGLFEDSFIYSRRAGLTVACRLATEATGI